MYRRNMWINVSMDDNDRLRAVASYLDAWNEMEMQLLLTPASFQVENARIEVCRSPAGSQPGSWELPELVGIPAYPGSTRAFIEATAVDPSGRLGDLALELIKGVLQAEAFLWRERGFSSPANYDCWFEQEYRNTCIYYANFSQINQEWHEYISDQVRGRALFNRFRNSHVAGFTGNGQLQPAKTSKDQEQELLVEAALIDSFHEVTLELKVEPGRDKVVKAASAIIHRVPDSICRQALGRVANLEGRSLSPVKANRKELQTTAGGPGGCTHLADLAQECARTLELASSNINESGGEILIER